MNPLSWLSNTSAQKTDKTDSDDFEEALSPSAVVNVQNYLEDDKSRDLSLDPTEISKKYDDDRGSQDYDVSSRSSHNYRNSSDGSSNLESSEDDWIFSESEDDNEKKHLFSIEDRFLYDRLPANLYLKSLSWQEASHGPALPEQVREYFRERNLLSWIFRCKRLRRGLQTFFIVDFAPRVPLRALLRQRTDEIYVERIRVTIYTSDIYFWDSKPRSSCEVEKEAIEMCRLHQIPSPRLLHSGECTFGDRTCLFSVMTCERITTTRPLGLKSPQAELTLLAETVGKIYTKTRRDLQDSPPLKHLASFCDHKDHFRHVMATVVLDSRNDLLHAVARYVGRITKSDRSPILPPGLCHGNLTRTPFKYLHVNSQANVDEISDWTQAGFVDLRLQLARICYDMQLNRDQEEHFWNAVSRVCELPPGSSARYFEILDRFLTFAALASLRHVCNFHFIRRHEVQDRGVDVEADELPRCEISVMNEKYRQVVRYFVALGVIPADFDLM